MKDIPALILEAQFWHTLTPQQQVVFVIHRLTEVAGSPDFHELPGVQIRVRSLDNLVSSETIVKIGPDANPGSIIQIN